MTFMPISDDHSVSSRHLVAIELVATFKGINFQLACMRRERSTAVTDTTVRRKGEGVLCWLVENWENSVGKASKGRWF
jgi:hypothetical protein